MKSSWQKNPKLMEAVRSTEETPFGNRGKQVQKYQTRKGKMERKENKSAFFPVSLVKELSSLISSISVTTTHQCNLPGISSVVLYTHSKFRVKGLTVKV